jgi:thiamine biosynthesis lipoprotein
MIRRAAALCVLLAAACASGYLLRLQKSADAMGTTFTVIVYGAAGQELETAIDAAFAELQRLDEMLSNYKPGSEWSVVNRFAAQRPVKVTPELFRLLSECLRYSRETEGAFDITVGPLVKVWGFYGGRGQLPQAEDVTAALGLVGYRHLHLDAAGGAVSFDLPGVELDPGGFGKGYAVDRMAGILRRRGLSAALVTASDSSIYGMGTPPAERRGWLVEIGDPRDHRRSVAEVFLKDMAISTSGSYEKSFRVRGRTFSHIINPRTGRPAEGIKSATVVAPRAIGTEVWTKPYFLNGRVWAARHRLKDSRIFLCEDRPGAGCAWVE